MSAAPIDPPDEKKPHWFIEWIRPNFKARQIAIYVIGCLLFSFGANFFIYSKLGTDPLDVFSLGLCKHVSFMSVGIAQGGFAAICLLIWAAWNKRLPLISPFVTFFFCGTLIDLWMGEKYRHGANIASFVPLPPYPLMIAGVILCAYGSSLIIMSGIGIRSMDLVAITMVHKWKAPFWVWKTVLELCLLVSGYVMGGPVGVGTVCFVGFVDLLIQPMMIANTKLFGMANHGLRGKKEAPEGAPA